MNSNNLVELIKRIIPPRYHFGISNTKKMIFGGFATKSFSQEGEDMILKRIFEDKKDGFYIDVGAHHPKRWSNTYYFYKKGWKGLNIDAMPGSMSRFKISRKRDINVEAAVSDKKQYLTYYQYSEPAFNGFVEKENTQTKIRNSIHLLSKKRIETFKLSELLNRFLPKNTKIDFLSVDVEGFDLKVLKSNDWNKYLPEIVLVEIPEFSLENKKDATYEFLREKGYLLYAKTFNTVIFKLKKSE